jgi:hypothetical protein
MSFTLVAATGERFASFGPYVACVNDAGVVAFAATLTDGRSGVFTGEGAEVLEHPAPTDLREVTSHPDVNAGGALSYYGALANGDTGVFLVTAGEVRPLAEGFHSIGPAGPTMNDEGAVAFRGEREAAVAGVFLAAAAGDVTTIVEVGDLFAAFTGLPLVDARGGVVFRADRRDGTEGIYRSERGVIEPIVETGNGFSTIGRFPSCVGDEVVLVATTVDGLENAFFARDGDVRSAVGGDAFASHRGALLAGRTLVRIATPRGGRLGVFRGPDPIADRIVAIDDPLLGSTVEDLAANAVSVNRSGHLAIRLALADGREAIVRADLA